MKRKTYLRKNTVRAPTALYFQGFIETLTPDSLIQRELSISADWDAGHADSEILTDSEDGDDDYWALRYGFGFGGGPEGYAKYLARRAAHKARDFPNGYSSDEADNADEEDDEEKGEDDGQDEAYDAENENNEEDEEDEGDDGDDEYDGDENEE